METQISPVVQKTEGKNRNRKILLVSRNPKAVTVMKCGGCGSTNGKLLNAEFGLSKPWIYALEEIVLCLPCGFSEWFFSEDVLAKLRVNSAARSWRPAPNDQAVMPTRCRICGSNQARMFDAEVAFGRGVAAPPVHVKESRGLRVCLDCGLSEYYVPESSLVQLREGAHPRYSLDISRPSSQEKSA